MRDRHHVAAVMPFVGTMHLPHHRVRMPEYPYREVPERVWPYWDVPVDLPDYEYPQEPVWFPDF